VNVLQGNLIDRDAWSTAGRCPIEKTMALVGQMSALLVMREAFYGATRFDDFVRRVGITAAPLSFRLPELVARADRHTGANGGSRRRREPSTGRAQVIYAGWPQATVRWVEARFN
jgi:hypothetical protein